MVSSNAYPGLERVPGKQNWVDYAGGLPKYIERIAKHLHYEKGMSISHAIASAVNTVKRWARMGKVAKYGDPNHKHVSPATVAKSIKAVAEWEAKRAKGRLHLSEVLLRMIDLSDVTDEFALDLAEELGFAVIDLASSPTWLKAQTCKYCSSPATKAILHAEGMAYIPTCDGHLAKGKGDAEKATPDGTPDPTNIDGIYDLQTKCRVDTPETGTSADLSLDARLSSVNIDLGKDGMDIQALAERANRVEDPEARAAARQAVLDLASTIPPRNARGRVSDGRKSFKGQGHWKHGFIPVNTAAKEAKSKGSPIAMKRMRRLFGKDKVADDPRPAAVGKGGAPGQGSAPRSRTPDRERVRSAVGRVGNRSAGGRKNNRTHDGQVSVSEQSNPTSEKANDVAFFRHQKANKDVSPTKDNTLPGSQKEASKASRIPTRATQNWDEIPEELKTVRNGEKYVLAEFGGKGYLTKWLGGVHKVDQTTLDKRKIMRTLTSADAGDMSNAQLNDLINNPRTPDSVRKVARKALRSKS